MNHTIFKVTPGKENTWRQWCEFLRYHEEEAKETIREENCIYERAIMYEEDGKYYVIGSAGFEREPQPANPDRWLNQMHRKAKEICFCEVIEKFEGNIEIPENREVLYEFYK